VSKLSRSDWPEKGNSYGIKLHILCLVILLISSTIWTSCGGAETPVQPAQPSSGDERPSLPVNRPDLAISAIEIFPTQQQTGTHFAINIYVKNMGQAPSGKYDLAIFIKDVSHDSTYPVGTFRQDALQPGDNVVAYSSTNRLVNDPGSYQAHVEIEPFLFEDSNTNNNTAIRAFTVK